MRRPLDVCDIDDADLARPAPLNFFPKTFMSLGSKQEVRMRCMVYSTRISARSHPLKNLVAEGEEQTEAPSSEAPKAPSKVARRRRRQERRRRRQERRRRRRERRQRRRERERQQEGQLGAEGAEIDNIKQRRQGEKNIK